MACNKEPEEKGEAYYAENAQIFSDDNHFSSNDEGGTISFNAEGGTVVLVVACEIDWTFVNGAQDLFGAVASVSDGTLTVTAEQNEDEEEKTGTITLYTEQSRIKFGTIEIVQNAYGAPEITVETNEWNIPAVGEQLTTEIVVEASADYEIALEDDCDWITAVKTEKGVSLTATENDTTVERTTNVTLNCSDGIRTTSAYIAVTQEPKAYITLSTETLNLSVEEQTTEVTVETNFDWDFTYDQTGGWATVTKNNSGNALTISVQAHDGEGERQCTVSLTAGDGAENVAEAELTIIQAGSTALVLVYTITSAGTAIQLPLTGVVDCTVDWGDGSESEAVTSTLPKHTYENTGEYTVKIDGTVTGLSSASLIKYDDEDDEIPLTDLTEVKQWGKTGLVSMSYAFYYNTGLQSIPTDIDGSFADVTNFDYAFCNTRISEIPEGLLDYATKVESMIWAFEYCSLVKTIPTGLLDACTEVEAMTGLFSYTGISSIPAGLFDHNAKVTKSASIFMYCSSLTDEIPAGLFDNLTEATTFGNIFLGTPIPAIPEGLFDKNTKVTSFMQAFNSCTELKTIPAGLFDNCPDVTTYQSLFGGCTGLTSVPGKLFAKNTASSVTYSSIFHRCSGLTSVPDDLLVGLGNAKTIASILGASGITTVPEDLFQDIDPESNVTSTDLFEDCTSLETVPAGLFKNFKSVTSLSNLFSGCTSLKTVPAGLFDSCTALTGFVSFFQNCSSLTEVPDGLFDNCPNATGCGYCFQNCTALKTVPVGLFNNQFKFTACQYCFDGCTALTGESPYREWAVDADGKLVEPSEGDETIKVHLYEHGSHTDVYSTIRSYTHCFRYCTGLTDYNDLSSSWQ